MRSNRKKRWSTAYRTKYSPKKVDRILQRIYNHQIKPDTSIINDHQNGNRPAPSPLPVLKEEVTEVIRSLPDNKPPGMDNIPAELLKHGREQLTNILTTICNNIWRHSNGRRSGHNPSSSLYQKREFMTMPKV